MNLSIDKFESQFWVFLDRKRKFQPKSSLFRPTPRQETSFLMQKSVELKWLFETI